MLIGETEFFHAPVLCDEILALVDADASLVFDATLGLGGHSEALLTAFENLTVIGLDQDEAAIAIANKRLERFGKRFRPVHSNFENIDQVIVDEDMSQADMIIADLGVSSMQLDDVNRGFSFRLDAVLDMRMDRTSNRPTAADLLVTMDETELADTIFRYGQERASRRIARWIKQRNSLGRPITTTGELADLVARAVGGKKKSKIHPATRTFQALRIAVNNELEVLRTFLDRAVESLKMDGVLALITFHSLEDAIVKHEFQRLSGKCVCPPRIPTCVCGTQRKIEILTRKPISPGEIELDANPRSRSAKLRACRKLGH